MDRFRPWRNAVGLHWFLSLEGHQSLAVPALSVHQAATSAAYECMGTHRTALSIMQTFSQTAIVGLFLVCMGCAAPRKTPPSTPLPLPPAAGLLIGADLRGTVATAAASDNFSPAQQGLSSGTLPSPAVPPGQTPSVLPYPKVPHPACPNCFTYDCPACYTIFEEVLGTGIILTREIPNPAPQLPEGVRMHDNAGRPIWYIGRQPYVGPTDEEPFSQELPIPLIELKRIQARHHQEIFSIPGVHGFGIGAKGFVVFLDPTQRDSASRIPKALEGVLVTVEVGGPFVFTGGAVAASP